MRTLWSIAAVVAAVALWAGGAVAQTPFDLSNTTSPRWAILATEDSGELTCVNNTDPNLGPGNPSAAHADCTVFAGDGSAHFNEPTNDYYALMTYLGVGSGGVGHKWQLDATQALWEYVMTQELAESGTVLDQGNGGVTQPLSMIIDTGTPVSVTPTNGSHFYEAFAINQSSMTQLRLRGITLQPDFPFYGSALNVATGQGNPLVLSCSSWQSGSGTFPLFSAPYNAGVCNGGAFINPPSPQVTFVPTVATFFTAFAAAQLTDPTGAVEILPSAWAPFDVALLETSDTDGDTVPDPFDNCPTTPNDQADSGSLGGTTPDGIGDACQCGDVNNDGIVNGIDGVLIGRSAVGLPPYGSLAGMPGFTKCDVNDGTCSGVDGVLVNRAAVGLPPGVAQTCPAAN